MDDLRFAIEQLIHTGHTVQIGPPRVYVPDVATVTVSVSGPSGSRQVTSNSVPDAVGQVVAMIVEARLSARPVTEETRRSLKRLGVLKHKFTG